MKRPRPSRWCIYILWLALLVAALLTLPSPDTTSKYVWQEHVDTFTVQWGE